jgi:hypothetical protein
MKKRNKDEGELRPFTTMLSRSNIRDLKKKAADDDEFLVDIINKVISKGLKK